MESRLIQTLALALTLGALPCACKPPADAPKEAFISGAGLRESAAAKPPPPKDPPKVAAPGGDPPPVQDPPPGDPDALNPMDAPPVQPPPEPGVPAEPPPGDPGQPPPPEGPGGPGPEQGPMITLKGRIDFPAYAGGVIQLDVMDGPSQGPTGNQPKVIRLERLEKPGPFTLRIPAKAGGIYLTAFNDADENGRPNREDPRGTYGDNPVEIGTEDIEGIVLTLAIEEVPPPPGQF